MARPSGSQQEMGKAQAGVMQGAEAGRQNAIRDLQSYGIDPSSGRYAALDKANRVMAGATAAGAGNQQRMATEAHGSAMQNQAMSASLQNTQIGYGAANAMNQLLGTGMQLKYSPLGTKSYSGSQSSGTSSSPARRSRPVPIIRRHDPVLRLELVGPAHRPPEPNQLPACPVRSIRGLPAWPRAGMFPTSSVAPTAMGRRRSRQPDGRRIHHPQGRRGVEGQGVFLQAHGPVAQAARDSGGRTVPAWAMEQTDETSAPERFWSQGQPG